MTNRNKYLKRKYLINREIRDNYPEKNSGQAVLNIYIIFPKHWYKPECG